MSTKRRSSATRVVKGDAGFCRRLNHNKIDRLPMPKAEWEREERTDTIFWLMLSQRPTHVKNAVKLYRDMQLAEEAVREEVLRGN